MRKFMGAIVAFFFMSTLLSACDNKANNGTDKAQGTVQISGVAAQ